MRLFILISLGIILPFSAPGAEELPACKSGYFIRLYSFCPADPPVYADKENSWACTPNTKTAPGRNKVAILKTVTLAGMGNSNRIDDTARAASCEGMVPIENLKDLEGNAKDYVWRMGLVPGEATFQEASVAYVISPGRPTPTKKGQAPGAVAAPASGVKTCQLQITLTYGGPGFDSLRVTPSGCRHPAHGFDERYFHLQKKCGLSESKTYFGENETPGDRADGESRCMTADQMPEESDTQKIAKIEAIRENLRLALGPNDRRDGRIESMSLFEIKRLTAALSGRDPNQAAGGAESNGIYSSLWLYVNSNWKGGAVPEPSAGTNPAQFNLKVVEDAINRAIVAKDQAMLDNIRKYVAAECAVMQKSYFSSRFQIPQERFLFLFPDPKQTVVRHDQLGDLNGQFNNANAEGLIRIADAFARSELAYLRELRGRHLKVLALRFDLRKPDADPAALLKDLSAQAIFTPKERSQSEKEFTELAGRGPEQRRFVENLISTQMRGLWQEEQKSAGELKAMAAALKARSSEPAEQALLQAYVALYEVDVPGFAQALGAVEDSAGKTSQAPFIKWAMANLVASANAAAAELTQMRAIMNQEEKQGSDAAVFHKLAEIASQSEGAVDTKLAVLIDSISREDKENPAAVNVRSELAAQLEKTYGAFLKTVRARPDRVEY